MDKPTGEEKTEIPVWQFIDTSEENSLRIYIIPVKFLAGKNFKGAMEHTETDGKQDVVIEKFPFGCLAAHISFDNGGIDEDDYSAIRGELIYNGKIKFPDGISSAAELVRDYSIPFVGGITVIEKIVHCYDAYG